MLSQVVTGACLEAQIMQQPVAIASLKPDGWLVHIYTNLKQYGGSISRWTATHSVTHTCITLHMAAFFWSCGKLANCYVVDTK